MGTGAPIPSGALGTFLVVVPVWFLLANTVGLYHLADRRVEHSFADEVGPVFLVTTVWVWLYLLACAVLLQGTIDLLGPSTLWVVAIFAILLARSTVRLIARNREWYRRPVVLVGDREGTDRVLRRVLRHPEWGLDVASRVNINTGAPELQTITRGEVTHSYPIDGAHGNRFATRLASVIDALDIDRVIITGTSTSLTERTELARLLTERGHCVDYVYGEPEALYAAALLHQLEGLPVLSVQPTRLSRGSAAMKRGLDIAVSLAGLVLLSPVFAIVAIWIKLDSRGPVFFRQPRMGREATAFDAIKFRTMVDGADDMRPAMREYSLHGNGAGMLKVRDDPRITRCGAKLRRWSIDELPQLWNVLRADMSLVGPRPLPLDEAPLVKGHFEIRTRVRPGITGTWQTSGRSDIPFDDMVKLDYTYVAGWSLREDLRLLLRTFAVVAQGRGTY
jgi:exopolysaccharide biosynthesis polyprenyl glycosylphosphotransferase